jgi:hypothetical protein
MGLKEKLAKMSPDERDFLLRDTPYHLFKKSQFERLEKLLIDFDFIQAKINDIGLQELIDDYKLTSNPESWNELRLIQKALYMLEDINQSPLAIQLNNLLVCANYLPKIQQYRS